MIKNLSSQCTTTGGCSDDELCMIQWGSRGVTNLLGNESFIQGFKDLNNSFMMEFELGTGNNSLQQFSLREVQRLMSRNSDYSQSNEPTSLLNFSNANFLTSYLNKTDKLADRFKLTLDQASLLSPYYSQVLRALGRTAINYQISYFRGTL